MLIETFSGDYLNARKVVIYRIEANGTKDTHVITATRQSGNCFFTLASFETKVLATAGMRRLASLLAERGRALITQEDIHANPEDPDKIWIWDKGSMRKVTWATDAPPLKYRLGWLNDRGERWYDSPADDASFDSVKAQRDFYQEKDEAVCGMRDIHIYLVEQDGSLTLMEE